jgi:Ca2+/Na+ antiporter
VIFFLIGLQLLFVFNRPVTDRSPPKYYWLVCIISVFSSLLWSKLASSLLVSIFRGLGFILDIPITYLGFVFLAAGNALPDGLATISLAGLG